MSQISIHGRFIVIIIVVCTINLTKVEGRKCVCTSKDCKEAGEDTCETKYYCYTELILFTDQEFGENTTTRGCTQSPTPLLCETKSWVTRSKLSTSSFDDDEKDEIVENRHVSSTRLWIRMSWPRLKCCDSQDYCNADHLGDLSTWIREREKEEGKKRKKIKEKGEKVGKEEKFSFGRMNQNNNLTSNAGIDQNDNLESSNKFNQNNNLISLNSNRSFTNSSSSSQNQIISISSESISTINENLDSNHFLQHRVRPLHVAVFVLAISALISVLAACYVIMRALSSLRRTSRKDKKNALLKETCWRNILRLELPIILEYNKC
ncbi:putative E3 ubiquitin-protein ligase protein PFF1365c isoform X2 [Vespa mandarinia]|uniref:putative E3 ubiquitin-protein ligase protein PFF1365c isoform X2 n=1 Tax=Vespa mandarinia TaxID=7446 RepID=UPI001616FBD1|nr:putative E3 ubiquitin-protein ligase protein PFF1365c isoform X2 [Vespa mandarinia]